MDRNEEITRLRARFLAKSRHAIELRQHAEFKNKTKRALETKIQAIIAASGGKVSRSGAINILRQNNQYR